MYECPKCHAQIPSDVADARVGRDHKKPDKKSKCGYQFEVKAGKQKQNATGAGTYRCFAHGNCKGKASNRYAVVAEDIHEKKKQGRMRGGARLRPSTTVLELLRLGQGRSGRCVPARECTKWCEVKALNDCPRAPEARSGTLRAVCPGPRVHQVVRS